MNPSDPTDRSPSEPWLRDALRIVAGRTPVPDRPAPGVAPLAAVDTNSPSSTRRRPMWGIVAAAAALVVLVGGTAFIAAQRDREHVDLTPGGPVASAPGTDPGPAVDDSPIVAPDHRSQDHWHDAYGFYVCDTFLTPVTDVDPNSDPLGIHTHGDGLIHIHPFEAASSGPNARMQLFGDKVGIRFTDDGWITPDGSVYRNGDTTCGGQRSTTVVYRWDVDDPSRPPEVFTKDFGDITFVADRQAYTFAVVPEGVTPPKPPTIPVLDQLIDAGSSGHGTYDPTPGTTPVSVP